MKSDLFLVWFVRLFVHEIIDDKSDRCHHSQWFDIKINFFFGNKTVFFFFRCFCVASLSAVRSFCHSFRLIVISIGNAVTSNMSKLKIWLTLLAETYRLPSNLLFFFIWTEIFDMIGRRMGNDVICLELSDLSSSLRLIEFYSIFDWFYFWDMLIPSVQYIEWHYYGYILKGIKCTMHKTQNFRLELDVLVRKYARNYRFSLCTQRMPLEIMHRIIHNVLWAHESTTSDHLFWNMYAFAAIGFIFIYFFFLSLYFNSFGSFHLFNFLVQLYVEERC